MSSETERGSGGDAGSPSNDGGGPVAFSDEESTEGRILTGLSQIGVALRARMWDRASPLGLNPTQARILSLLRRRGEAGASLSELAEALQVTPPTASDSVSTLEGRGLVVKRPRERDRRSVAVSLTDAGREAAESLVGWPDALSACVGDLGEAEQADLLRTLVKLVGRLQEADQIAPASACVTCRFFEPNVYPDPERPHRCGFVGAPFGDSNLRLECPDHEPASSDRRAASWVRWGAGS